MSDECRIDVRSQGTGLELEVFNSALVPNPRTCPRERPNLTQDELDKLRAGNASPSLVDDITARVSQWLQLPDLQDLPTILGFAAADDKPRRIIFNVSNVRDERLRYELADFPIEMATAQGDVLPLSLHARVGSIVHQLPKVGTPRVSAATGWPLKVLVVRSGPANLPAVPPVAAIAQTIRTLNPALTGANGVQVDVLSTEVGGPFAGPPTKEAMREQLGKASYHVLVFLGHGDLRDTAGSTIPVGQLQLETPNRRHDPFDGKRLSGLLHEFPVPVVLLVGCLTAADLTAEQLPEVEAELPKWLRGSQGVAQALINSTSGVQCAVGMRYRVDGSDAELFLRKFFESLLVPRAALPPQHARRWLGDVEHAVKTARSALHQLGNQPLGWAAPVLFRTLGTEPMFPFVAAPPSYEIADDQRQARSEIWQALAEIDWGTRANGGAGLYGRIKKMIENLDEEVLLDVEEHAALIMPKRLEVDPGTLNPAPAKTTCNVTITLFRSIAVETVAGSITETSQKGVIQNVALTAAARAAGFSITRQREHLQSAVVPFQIRHDSGAAAMLPAGPLLTIDVAIGSSFEAVYPLNIEALRSLPSVTLSGVANAIIVPVP